MKNQIRLEFPKTTSDLTGNEYGRAIFREQVKENIVNSNSEISVEIPESINDVGTSFVQGMYFYLSETYGSEKALEIMHLYSKKEETDEKIKRVIEVYGI